MPEKTNIELKPCPFCGGKAKLVGHERFHEYYVYCNNCMAASWDYETSEEAANAWDNRQIQANARLIATAPELFKIVEALANSQFHQYSEIKMKASELLKSLEEVKND